jgi:hypothetical protein
LKICKNLVQYSGVRLKESGKGKDSFNQDIMGCPGTLIKTDSEVPNTSNFRCKNKTKKGIKVEEQFIYVCCSDKV